MLVIYHTDNNETFVTVPSPEFLGQLMDAGLTELEAVDLIRKKDIPKHHEGFIGHSNLSPQDRYFRNAWECDTINNRITVNVVKARAIQKDRIIEMHNSIYDDLNREISKSEDREFHAMTGDLKQKRKDLLLEIDNLDAILDSMNIDELRNYQPAAFSGLI